MNQTKIAVLVVVLFAAAAFIGGYLVRGPSDAEPLPTASPVVSSETSAVPSTPSAPPNTAPRVHTVVYSASGPSPKTLTVRVGDAVTFRNASSTEVWPASDPHPSHSLCAGFDSRRGLRSGEEYTLTFTAPNTCTYHSHIDPFNTTLRGTIIVQ